MDLTTNLIQIENNKPAIPPAWRNAVDELVALGSAIGAVRSEVELADAADAAKMIGRLHEEIEDQKKRALEIPKEIVKKVNDLVNPLLGDLKTEKDRLRGEIGKYQQAKLDAEEKERRAVQEQQFKEDNEKGRRFLAGQEVIAETPKPEPMRSPVSYGQASTSFKWAWEISDFMTLPDKYKIPHETLLNAEAKVKPEPNPIPGLQWKKVPRTSIR